MTKRKRTGFTMMPTALLWDKSISLNAKAIYGVIKSSVPGWNPSVKGYSSVMKEGKAAISNAIAELERAGYVTRSYKRDKTGKYCSTEYITHEEPISDTQDPAEPATDFSATDNQVGNITSEETISKDINNKEITSNEDNTVCLTGDVEFFEKYLRRSLMPSEFPIWERWAEEDISSDVIIRAVEDNEYRGEKMNLHHVDKTIRIWKECNLNTLKAIDAHVLNDKYERTRVFLYEKYKYDEEAYERELAASEVSQTIFIRDDLMGMYKTDGEQFLTYVGMCPVEVFRYLPDEVLKVAIHYFEGIGDFERKDAAIAALDKEVHL